ncbi:unnamed protein product [Urochloa humidicola]
MATEQKGPPRSGVGAGAGLATGDRRVDAGTRWSLAWLRERRRRPSIKWCVRPSFLMRSLRQWGQSWRSTCSQLLTGMDSRVQRLKVICEGKLSGGIGVDTAATTLALAEQHNYSLLRAKCVEFITASPETLDAVVETEGYKHLMASCPLVFTELLKAAHGRKK